MKISLLLVNLPFFLRFLLVPIGLFSLVIILIYLYRGFSLLRIMWHLHWFTTALTRGIWTKCDDLEPAVPLVASLSSVLTGLQLPSLFASPTLQAILISGPWHLLFLLSDFFPWSLHGGSFSTFSWEITTQWGLSSPPWLKYFPFPLTPPTPIPRCSFTLCQLPKFYFLHGFFTL